MYSPYISIIVPIYNVEPYLNRCLQSLLNQTLKNIEIILVDDESPDNCSKICDLYAQNDSRIKVIHKQNGGLGFARNSGLDIATGTFIAFVDSDDFIELDMYKTLYEDAIKEDADIVFCNFKREKIDQSWIECKEIKCRKVFKGPEVTELMLDLVSSAPYIKCERKYQMSVWHAIYKRSIIEKHKLRFLSEREIASEDIPFNVEYLQQCNTIVYRPECFYYYCLNNCSLTAKYLPEKFNRYKTLYFYLKKKLSHYGDTGIIRINRFFIGMIRSQILDLISTKRNDKFIICNFISSDDIWNIIMKNFKYTWIPKPAAILLWLLVNKHIHLLIIYAKIYNFIRKNK